MNESWEEEARFLTNTLKYKKEQEKAVDKTRGSKGKKKKKAAAGVAVAALKGSSVDLVCS